MRKEIVWVTPTENALLSNKELYYTIACSHKPQISIFTASFFCTPFIVTILTT